MTLSCCSLCTRTPSSVSQITTRTFSTSANTNYPAVKSSWRSCEGRARASLCPTWTTPTRLYETTWRGLCERDTSFGFLTSIHSAARWCLLERSRASSSRHALCSNVGLFPAHTPQLGGGLFPQQVRDQIAGIHCNSPRRFSDSSRSRLSQRLDPWRSSLHSRCVIACIVSRDDTGKRHGHCTSFWIPHFMGAGHWYRIVRSVDGETPTVRGEVRDTGGQASFSMTSRPPIEARKTCVLCLFAWRNNPKKC